MTGLGSTKDIDFTVDTNNLYREEGITDIKAASIRQLIPIHADGTDDPSRNTIYVAHSQLISPEGPIPLQARLQATSLDGALKEFPEAMDKALSEIIAQIQQMKAQQQQDSSRIIMPGR